MLVVAVVQEEIPDSPLYVDAALVCTGRVPNTQPLELDKAGIETVRGFVQVRSDFMMCPWHVSLPPAHLPLSRWLYHTCVPP